MQKEGGGEDNQERVDKSYRVDGTGDHSGKTVSKEQTTVERSGLCCPQPPNQGWLNNNNTNMHVHSHSVDKRSLGYFPMGPCPS